MQRIVKKDGYVYLVEGEKGFETFYNLGKDPDDERWKEEIVKPKKKTNKKKKEED